MSRILPTVLVFISGYANTENVFYCLNVPLQDTGLLKEWLYWPFRQLTPDHKESSTSTEVCFAACLRWFVTCKANSLVGVIISARKGFFALSLINDSFFSSVEGASFACSMSWLDFLFRMWVRSGIPNARVLPDPWEIKNTLWKASKGTKQHQQISSSLRLKWRITLLWIVLMTAFTWHQSWPH